MVDPDRGNDGRVAVDRVDGVETPAETDFKNHHVGIRMLEKTQDAERRVFEVGERPFAGFLHFG